MQQATLAAQDISKKFIQGKEEVIVLDGINATFTQQKSFAVTGISGSGKSTFMHILSGIDTPTYGNILFNNRAIYTFSDSERCQFLNKSIGLVFQSPHLLRELSVLENVMLPGLIGGRSKNDCTQHAQLLLKKVGLFEKKDSKPGELSGGQQQRVAIARALFNGPAFLIADEPTGNLDLATGKSIIDVLLSCRDEWGMGIIVSSHDEYVTQKMDVVYELNEGKLTTI
jgi:lipoprotein-releasing system ATP-binding protein